MGLPLKPTLPQIRDEFAANTKPAVNTLRNFYVEGFGSAPAGSRQSNFGNTGQPIIPVSSYNATSIGNHQFTFNFEITFLGITVAAKPLVAIIQYREGSSGGWTTFTTNEYTAGGVKSVTITGLKSGTSYEARVVYYNSFNSHASDHKGNGAGEVLGVTTTGLQSIYLTYNASSGATACSDWADPNNYVQYWYTPSGSFSDATFLYTTNAQTNPAPDGFYARGTEGSFTGADYRRQVSGGSGGLIAGQTSC